MAAVIGPEAAVAEGFCSEASQSGVIVEPAGYNCPGQTVVAGHVEGVDRVVALAEEAGARAVKLQVSAPFHCQLLKPAGDKLAQDLDQTSVGDLKVPYIPNVTGVVSEDSQNIAQGLVDQVSQPVRWLATMESMVKAGVTEVLEVGPGKTLLGFMRKFDRRFPAQAVDNPKTWTELTGT